MGDDLPPDGTVTNELCAGPLGVADDAPQADTEDCPCDAGAELGGAADGAAHAVADGCPADAGAEL